MRMLSEADIDSFFVGTATHEAGHAVVAEVLGIQVTLVKVSITPDGLGENGRVEVDEKTYDEADEAAAIMAAAGPVAEAMKERSLINHNRRHLNDKLHFRPRMPRLEGPDLDIVNRHLDLHYYSSPADRRDKRDEFSRKAEKVLLENWGAVKSVARKLVEVSGEKDGRQFAELDRAAFLAAMKKGKKG